MRVVLFDQAEWRKSLLPLSWTRPVSDLRVGIVTIAEKWSLWLKGTSSFLTEPYLRGKYPLSTAFAYIPGLGAHSTTAGQDIQLLLRGNVLPNEALCEALMNLKAGQVLLDQRGKWLGFSANFNQSDLEPITSEADLLRRFLPEFEARSFEGTYTQISHPEDIFLNNGAEIQSDFLKLTSSRASAPLSSSNQLLGDQIFLEEGAQVDCSTLNSLKGPIYLDRHSEIWEGCLVRGPFSLGAHAQVKMGARIYSGVTVGPQSRVGGELNTCVIWGYSSKGHDGYMGNAVIGEWCNWGADTNNSNLKNNYKNVKVFDYALRRFRDSGLQFYGLIMGDHAKCAINTSFNTGTVVGVGASVFGAGFPPSFVPDFSWGGSDGFTTHQLERMQETVELVFARRNRIFDQVEKRLLDEVFELSKSYRAF